MGDKIMYDPQKFEREVNELYSAGACLINGQPHNVKLVDGYAPFCKHLFVPNFANVQGW